MDWGLVAKAGLAILGAVVLGAVGNGIWEYIMRPGLTRIYRVALRLGTLGRAEFRDSFYRELATNNAQAAAFEAAFSAAGILNAVYSSLAGMAIGVAFLVARRATGTLKPPEWIGSHGVQAGLIGVACLLIGIVVATIMRAIRLRYLCTCQAHFARCKSILAFKVTQAELAEWEFAFATIRNRSDYMRLIVVLRKAARRVNLPFPWIWVW